MRPTVPLFWILALLAIPSLEPALGQEVQTLTPGQEEPLRVFLDCWRCDMDHFRREVAFISYVRDRMDAQLHVLVTSQETGAGGTEYTFNFIGLREFSGRDHTLTVASRPDDTDDETRADLIRVFKLGLVPFIASSEIGRGLDVTYRGPRGEAAVEQVEDPWNLWVFNLRAGGELEGESSENSSAFDGSFSASRTTDELKMDFRASGEWDRRTIDFGEGEESTYTSREYEIEGLTVWSLSPHWSAGVSGSASGSTRQNQDLAIRGGPAMEYNYFPYSESTRRQITVLYKVELASFDYEEITLFEETSEIRPAQSLEIAAAFNQPWGELDINLRASGGHSHRGYPAEKERVGNGLPILHRNRFQLHLRVRLQQRGEPADVVGGRTREVSALEEWNDPCPNRKLSERARRRSGSRGN